MTELDDYTVSLDKSDVLLIEQNIAKNGAEQEFLNQLHFLDCSKELTSTNGTKIRAIQTIDYRYQDHVSQAVYILNTYLPRREDLFNQLVELHRANLKFEEDNPPVWYTKKKWTKKRKANVVPKEPKKRITKESVKQIRLNSLVLKLKPK